jgi:hypothetical protein
LSDLFEHEKVIEQGLASFIDVGLSLLAIRDGKKYRHAGYATFEHYCQRRWKISDSRGRQLMSAANIASDLGSRETVTDVTVLPRAEAQVRPLAAVPAPERAEVWAEAVADADGGQPTAKQVEKAAAECDHVDYLGRFLATCHALRTWALAHPQEYALIYGSPVPGYAAPEDTIAPATRVPAVLLSILFDQTANGAATPAAPLPDDVAASIGPYRTFAGGQASDDLLVRGLSSWATLLGTVSLELFGHLHNVVEEGPDARAAFFDHQMREVAGGLGLAGR